MAQLTVADKIVIAAAELGESIFSAEDLVIGAWRSFPETFGLRGHLGNDNRPLYPDSNRVFAEIMGTKPVRKRGWIEKVGNKRYRLSESGRQRVAEVTGRTSIRKTALDRVTVDSVKRLLGSRAVTKYRAGMADEITFLDACSLWGITPRSSSNELAVKFSEFDLLLDDVAAAIGTEEFVLKHGDVPYSLDDLRMLRELSDGLRERFKGELQVIRSRQLER
jgi:hypothetical protein